MPRGARAVRQPMLSTRGARDLLLAALDRLQRQPHARGQRSRRAPANGPPTSSTSSASSTSTSRRGSTQHSRHVPSIAVPMSFWYASLHYLVTPAVLAFIFWKHRSDYRRARNGLVIGSAIGLVAYVLIPTAPPRLMGGGYIDTLGAVRVVRLVVRPRLRTGRARRAHQRARRDAVAPRRLDRLGGVGHVAVRQAHGARAVGAVRRGHDPRRHRDRQPLAARRGHGRRGRRDRHRGRVAAGRPAPRRHRAESTPSW